MIYYQLFQINRKNNYSTLIFAKMNAKAIATAREILLETNKTQTGTHRLTRLNACRIQKKTWRNATSQRITS